MSVRRLSVYFRCLAQLEEDGVKTISSQELAARFHLNSAQVRKDLAYFGEFGIRGIGYDTTNLRAEIQRILGLDREWRVVLVGFGNLGLGALSLPRLRAGRASGSRRSSTTTLRRSGAR
jgi:redox-sensing transcriptional repressor